MSLKTIKCWGAQHGGATTNGWTHVEKLVVRTLAETGTEPVVVPAY